MLRFIGFSLLLFIVVTACSPKNKDQTAAINFEFELFKMEKLGAIDSVIMDLALSSRDERIVEHAVKTCGIVRDSRFTKRIAGFCEKPDMGVREAAIFALGEIGDTTAIYYLEEVLLIEDFRSRLLAIEALGKIGDRTAAPFIRPILKKSEEEAYEAALALWRMADTSSLGHLKQLVSRTSGKGLYGAIYAMSRLAPDSCLSQFRKIFQRESSIDSVYRKTEAMAIKGLDAGVDSTFIAYLFETRFDSLDYAAIIELVRSMGSTGVGRKGLERLMDTTDDNGLKRVILLSLGKIGAVASWKSVEKHLQDPSLQVQLAAISVLPRVNRKSPTNTLKKLKSDGKWQVRAEVARSLGKVGSGRSLTELRLMLEDHDDRVKAAVIEGMGEYPIRRNLDIINAALNGSNDMVVRSVAADVLGSSGDLKALEILLAAASKNTGTADIDFARSLVAALGNFVDTSAAGKEASEAIKAYLVHPNRIVRRDAYAALGRFAPEDFDLGTFKVDLSNEEFEFIEDLKDLEIAALIETEKGDIKLKLDPALAPRTTANFIKLAKVGFYDSLTFHRVVQDFVVQGGCPRGDGWGGPGYMIREEINPIKFKRGTIGMATSGWNTGGSQFFICLSDQPHLDGRYTAFGNVIDGLPVLDKIEIGDKILSIKIEQGRF
jgi:cyclophilin family peptidyl-prolyl cis-trans isomerase/HEAT repeat protein